MSAIAKTLNPHKSSSYLTRMLYFPCSAHRLQAHAGHHQLTHHPPSFSVLDPLHSKFPQMSAELHSWSIQCPCVSHTAAQGLEAQRWNRGTWGCGKCRGGQRQMSETTSRLCSRVWLRLLGYLYVSLLQRRKPLLLDPDVSGRTDSSLIGRWQPAPAGVGTAAELLCHLLGNSPL